MLLGLVYGQNGSYIKLKMLALWEHNMAICQDLYLTNKSQIEKATT